MKTNFLVILGLFTFTNFANTPTEKNTNSHHDFFDHADRFIFPPKKKFDPEFRNLILDRAPQNVKKLAAIIQKCVEESKCPSPILFGAGNDITRNKSAQAIAESAEIPYVQLNAVFLLNENKAFDRQTVNSINKILKTKQKIIVFFEALECTKDHIYGQTVAYLLDLFERNPNIIVIASIQKPHELPSYLKEKFSFHLCIFNDTATIKQKKELLNYHLKKFHNECDQNCQEHISKLLKTVDPESIEAIVESAERNAYLGKEKWTISQKNLEASIKDYKEMQKVFEKRK